MNPVSPALASQQSRARQQAVAEDATNPVSPALASVLRSGRTEFNARFAAARHAFPRLNSQAFMQFLQTAVNDLAQDVERVRADRVSEVVMVAYDAALELAGQDLIGAASRCPFIEESWRRILPRIPSLVASAPDRVIAAVCNAVHQLASTQGTRPNEWIEAMETLAPQCAEVEAFLRLGQLVAWRAGLAHFRKSALAAADALPEALALAAVGAKQKTGWAAEREKLLGNPFYDPADGQPSGKLRMVGQAGAFRGFGGLFVEPPEIASAGEHFLVRSGDDSWLLTADLFGTTFHRARKSEFDLAKKGSRLPQGVQAGGARIDFKGQRLELPALGGFTSAAANLTTLALTGRFTHSVVLVALP
jgi:hypothetical protein